VFLYFFDGCGGVNGGLETSSALDEFVASGGMCVILGRLGADEGCMSGSGLMPPPPSMLLALASTIQIARTNGHWK